MDKAEANPESILAITAKKKKNVSSKCKKSEKFFAVARTKVVIPKIIKNENVLTKKALCRSSRFFHVAHMI